MSLIRVEIQAEVDATREIVYPLLATAEGLVRWLDAAELEEQVGGAIRVRMHEAEATGKVLSLQPPQHISFTWDWVDEPLGVVTVVAFDAIDHGARTHLTIRHVGLPPRQVEVHESLWRHWLDRLIAVVRTLPATEAAASRD